MKDYRQIIQGAKPGQIVREVDRAARGQAEVHSMTKVTSEIWAPHEIVEKLESLYGTTE